MPSFLRLATFIASCLLTVWALPGCSGNEGTGGKVEGGAMEKDKMEGAMDKGRMDGAMNKMEGAMEKGKMDGAMDKGKMDGPPK